MSEAQETFLSHLIELRQRLVRALLVYAVACVPTLYFSAELYDLLAAPLMSNLPEGARMIATGVISPFLIPMKIAFMAGLVLALPFLLYQAWAFVAPGLYIHEKKLALPLVVSSTVLFLAGMVFCYFIVFAFIASFAPKSISVAPDIEAYFNFVLGMFLAFGLAFEVPVVVVVLVLTGLVTVEQLREWRGYVVVGIFVIAAVVTPPDVVSQIALAVPMCILYEVGIIVGQMITKRKERAAATPE